MHRTRALTLAAVAAFALAAPLSSRADDAPKESEVLFPVPEGGISALDLVTVMGLQSPESGITWSPEDRALQNAKIMRAQPIRCPASHAFEVVRTLLMSKEIVLIPMGPAAAPSWYAVSARELASSITLKMKPESVELNDSNLAEYEERDGLYISTAIKVENMENLHDARTALQCMVTANNIGNVQEVPDAHCFVLTDFAPNVVAMVRAIRQMDAKAVRPAPRVEYVPLAKARVENLAPVLWDLFPAGRPSADPKAPPPDPRALRIVPDPWTNQIVLSGDPSAIASVRSVIGHLDRDAASACDASGAGR